ncbi:MAG: hypothetical protein HZC41_02885 [Chloroflexi bacterium]|nr:hypothetical protein [Chloroflexota bacterium]
MRTRWFVLSVVAILVLVLALLPAQAQDSGMIVCDSTLITLLYLAEHDYGFHPMTDVAQFDKGQFAPLFDAMMAEMMEATPEAMMEEATPEMMTEETMMEGMTQLQPGVVEGENEACTQLRAEVEAFLYETLKSGMMMK